jgi:hypothetical protein
MSYAANELFGKSDYNPFPRIIPEKVIVATLSPDVAETELAVGTPMAYDEAAYNWKPWSAAGTGDVDEIKAFVYPSPVQLDGSEEVLAQLMVKGEIHYEDVVRPDGESAADLREALRTQCMARGLIVRGLTDVR